MNSELHYVNKDEEEDTLKTKKMTQEQDQVTVNIFTLFTWTIEFFGLLVNF